VDRDTVQLWATAVGLAATAYSAILPDLCSVRNGDGGAHLAVSMQHAAMVAGGAIIVLAAVTQSPSVAIIGGASVVGMAAAYRHAMEVGQCPY
jgi:hypothetical protein